ncbi:MAG: hypothetical protein U5R31_13700 [Acidimicrobiia bacterium]|nr:hypothetical protein [Acidimicrobiia bacterium]
MFIALAAILGSDDEDETAETTTTAEPTTTTSEPATTTEQSTTAPSTTEPPPSLLEVIEEAVGDTLGDSNRDVERFSVTIDEASGSIVVTWAIDENLTEGLTKDTARREGRDILKAIRDSDAEYEIVTLEGTFSLVDQLGNAEEERVVFARYPRDLIEDINFENFDFKNTFEIVDGAFIHPAFVY